MIWPWTNYLWSGSWHTIRWWATLEPSMSLWRFFKKLWTWHENVMLMMMWPWHWSNDLGSGSWATFVPSMSLWCFFFKKLWTGHENAMLMMVWPWPNDLGSGSWATFVPGISLSCFFFKKLRTWHENAMLMMITMIGAGNALETQIPISYFSGCKDEF